MTVTPIVKVNTQPTKVDVSAKIEIFLEHINGYSSDLRGYIIVTGLRYVKGFGDLGLIFKVIVLYVGYLLNHWMDFLLTYIDYH